MNGWNIFFLILLLVILYFTLMTFLQIRLNYSIYYDWWNTYGGNDCKGKFNLTQVFAAYQVPSVFYYINKYTNQSIESELTIDSMDFLMDKIIPFVYQENYDNEGNIAGVIMPKNLCTSVKIEYKDGDKIFQSWYNNQPKRVSKNGTSLIREEAGPLTGYKADTASYDHSGTKTNYVYVYFNGDNATCGVYPSATPGSLDWQGLILEWLNGSGYPTKPDGDKCANFLWSFEPVKDSISYKLHPPGSGYIKYSNIKTTGIYDFWYGVNGQPKRPDNFLSRTGIGPEAPIIEWFLNNTYNYESITLNASAFADLLGSETQSITIGGWGAYAKYASTSKNKDDLVNALFSEMDQEYQKPICKERPSFPESMATKKFWRDVGLQTVLPGMMMVGYGLFTVASAGTLSVLTPAIFATGLAATGAMGFFQAASTTPSQAC